MTEQYVKRAFFEKYSTSLEEALSMCLGRIRREFTCATADLVSRLEALEARDADPTAQAIEAGLGIEVDEEDLAQVSGAILTAVKPVLLSEAEAIQGAALAAGLTQREADDQVKAWLTRTLGFIVPHLTEVASDWIASNGPPADVAAVQELPPAESARPAGGDAPEDGDSTPGGQVQNSEGSDHGTGVIPPLSLTRLPLDENSDDAS
jgi:hypothetical protein